MLDLDSMTQRGSFASECGTVSAFAIGGGRLRKLGEAKLDPHAQSVAVDPRTHRVYFPHEDVAGQSVLRVMQAE